MYEDVKEQTHRIKRLKCSEDPEGNKQVDLSLARAERKAQKEKLANVRFTEKEPNFANSFFKVSADEMRCSGKDIKKRKTIESEEKLGRKRKRSTAFFARDSEKSHKVKDVNEVYGQTKPEAVIKTYAR